MDVIQQKTALAVEGGPPIRQRPFPDWPCFGIDEQEAVLKVLRSGKVNYWTGEEGKRFEREFADFVGVKRAVAVANGTLALELALAALDIGRGDEVVVPSRTFIASASAVVMRGATPVIADIDPLSQNITLETIQAVASPRTKAIIAVHLAGQPCEMAPILEFAKARSIRVIEDCAQAHGATYRNQQVGSLGDVAAFSFCQDKILSTGGEGGMLVTNDRSLWERAWSLKDHGKSWNAVHHQHHTSVFKWLHERFGSNYRMTEMQAAIGRVALRRLPEWLELRRRNARRLEVGLKSIDGIELLPVTPGVQHSYYKYYAKLNTNLLRTGWSRDQVVRALQAEGIPCGSGACGEIYREQAFRQAGLGPVQPLAGAAAAGQASLMFQVHPTLGQSEMDDTCRAVAKVLKRALTSRTGRAA